MFLSRTSLFYFFFSILIIIILLTLSGSQQSLLDFLQMVDIVS